MSIVKLNNQSVKNATSFGSISALGTMILIKKLSASSSATLDFVNGSNGVVLDDTYKEYIFTFKNIHASTDDVLLQFQTDTGTNTNYNQTVTTTFVSARHGESNSPASLSYITNRDEAQTTNFVKLNYDIGDNNDDNICGILQLFNPSSDTFVKNFLSETIDNGRAGGSAQNNFVGGYFNTTTPLTRVQFKMSSGNIASGDICLYGIA